MWIGYGYGFVWIGCECAQWSNQTTPWEVVID
jgi:hypothetical protein